MTLALVIGWYMRISALKSHTIHLNARFKNIIGASYILLTSLQWFEIEHNITYFSWCYPNFFVIVCDWLFGYYEKRSKSLNGNELCFFLPNFLKLVFNSYPHTDFCRL